MSWQPAAPTSKPGGRQLRLVGPEVVRDPARSLVPKPVRVPIRLANVDEFMLLSRADAGA
jgi:hypothetical protein